MHAVLFSTLFRLVNLKGHQINRIRKYKMMFSSNLGPASHTFFFKRETGISVPVLCVKLNEIDTASIKIYNKKILWLLERNNPATLKRSMHANVGFVGAVRSSFDRIHLSPGQYILAYIVLLRYLIPSLERPHVWVAESWASCHIRAFIHRLFFQLHASDLLLQSRLNCFTHELRRTALRPVQLYKLQSARQYAEKGGAALLN